ncbi:hypothetical protein [Bradyrhizobium sp. CCGUVB23]|uniref:hypothetical protein n=1 Tax=Bradyrhizobium sp. CCGUVB23 TaxID=2949630 RepID=UPI0020B3F9D8|nr:hypothetical protein [Bradyrhizobium sp. CCGUVB23]MCP3460708.1 hypothetical protein [Bradyrhizobium sp. CCGUVB23]
MLLEHLTHGLDLVPEGFDAAQMRQAEQFVEALSEAEMGKALAQAIPGAVAVRWLVQGVQQWREIELGGEGNIDVDQRQRNRYGRRNGPFRGRPGLDPGLGFWHRAGGQAPAPDGLAGLEDPSVVTVEPSPTLKASGKNVRNVEPIREPVGFKQRTRRQEPVLLRKCQGVQQVAGTDRNVALAEAFQKDLCAGRILVQQRRRGGEQQDIPIARLCAHGLLSQRQKTRLEAAIGEGSQQNLIPRRVLPISARQLFRLIAKWENPLRRGCMRH